MPFRSEAQRRYLWMHDPKLAAKWAKKYKSKRELPMYVKKEREVAKKMRGN